MSIFTPTSLARFATTLTLAGTVAVLGAGAAMAAPGAAQAGVAHSANSTDDRGDVDTMSSRRITVTNNSSDTMKLTSVEGDNWFEGRPEDGSTIAPKGSHAWELTYKYAKTNADTVVYTLTAPDGSYDGSVTLDLRVESIGIWEPSVKSSCVTISSKAGIACEAGGAQITLSNS